MVELLTTANPVVQSIIGGATYGYVFYLRVRWDGTDTTEFDPVKFGTTVGLAAGLGLVLWILGIEPSFESTAYMITTFAGSVALLEAGIKALVRGERQAAEGHLEQAGQTAIDTLLGLGTTEGEVRDSVNSGARETEHRNTDELRGKWSGAYPDEETAHSVDDSDDEDETETATNRDLPPA